MIPVFCAGGSMSGDTLKRVKSVKRWLEKAENSYSNHKELTGEMNLIMAQAEMQRLKEVRGTSPRRKWLLRGGALAVAGLLFLGASLLKDSLFPPPVPAKPAQTVVTTSPETPKPVEEAVQKAEEVPAPVETVMTEQVETKQATEAPKAAPVVSTPVPAPIKAAAPKPAAPVLSDQEIQRVVGEAGRALRGNK